ncbi:Chromosome partitioning ATPase, Mrp family, contains Fe-S cluster [Desulfotomaculum arcticum]|uniref:Iron-sulfur cluster carrier protein n=1 Tax=Desulfotruncus arcticus DSM 17038 TaxID=1121424 RepID=A0A1I2V0F1_9FIRM|nr:Mrp/NBP35 family ATP-binding protein [Desulfotruncus arcticus]SFG81909.1 Chromosome partitioning ATPase, Mrp family, contains Fe-S cluster [Desulfotomaculum arcticum] [Desulfotruncus arcticus DSM 17038]
MAENEKCDSCNQKTEGCTPDKCGIDILPQNDYTEIKHVIAVMSGKGGVGKSSVSALLALSLARRGYRVGILDADITGPSIPKMFGISSRPLHDENVLYAAMTSSGIKIMSLNLLLENEDQPVIWRGPIIAGAVKQFWTDVAWGKIDFMVVDLPPGTGDVPLTVMQSLPLDGIVVVTSPQDLANMVVRKAVNMANHMNIPLLGFVENMSYLRCPDCGKEIKIFGESKSASLATSMGLRLLEKLPVDPELAELCDAGKVENYGAELFKDIEHLVLKKSGASIC